MRVSIFFDAKNKSKKYTYNIPNREYRTKEDYATEISRAMVLSDKRKHRSYNFQRYYSLILSLLQDNANIHTPAHKTDAQKNDDITYAFQQMEAMREKEVGVLQDNGNIFYRQWHVGISQSRRVCLDIDSHDEKNLKTVYDFYSNLFGYGFHVFRTGHGFWLIANEAEPTEECFIFRMLQIFQPNLDVSDWKRLYVEILSSDTTDSKASESMIKSAPWYHGVGNFDVFFVFLSLKRRKCTLRISKKKTNDRIEEIWIS